MTDTAVHFPVTADLTPLDARFGADPGTYLTQEQLPPEFYAMRHPMCRVASALFNFGGELIDHGLRFKPEIDAGQAMLAIDALLRSWAPKHEIKIGTVGYALQQWCEPAV